MRRRNLLAGLLLLPLGAAAGLFWWLQKSGPSLKPWDLIKSNVKFWKSEAGQRMESYPYFGVRIYNDLPRNETPDPGTVTVLPMSMDNAVGKGKYGNIVSYDLENPKYAEILFNRLLEMVPNVRIVNIYESNPWIDTDYFKHFIFMSTIKYLMAYGLLNVYPRVELHESVEYYCRDIVDYLKNPREVPEDGDCITTANQQFIKNQVIPALKTVDQYISNNLQLVRKLIDGDTYK